MKLYEFRTSPFAAKVRMVLALKRLPYEAIEVPYLDRRELLERSGGIMVPVLIDGAVVVCDSPRITAHLDERYAPSLRPGGLLAAARVFEEWSDNLLEETVFRLTAPAVQRLITANNGGRPDVAAIYRFSKERKYGTGCLESWRADESLHALRIAAMLAPLAQTVAEQPYLLGAEPTLADAAVWGQLNIIEQAWPGRVAELVPGLGTWLECMNRLAESSVTRR